MGLSREAKRGDAVQSLQGRDRHSLYLILEIRGNTALLCDGKRHPFDHGKQKNMKHLRLLDERFRLTEEDLRHLDGAPRGSGLENGIIRRWLKKAATEDALDASNRKE